MSARLKVVSDRSDGVTIKLACQERDCNSIAAHMAIRDDDVVLKILNQHRGQRFEKFEPHWNAVSLSLCINMLGHTDIGALRRLIAPEILLKLQEG